MSSAPRILVIGGAGFIGSHTADALLASGRQVRVLDNLQARVHPHGKPTYLPPAADFRHGDASDRVALANALDGVSSVFHFAAYQDYLPDFSTFIRVNVESTALLFELIVERGLPVRKVVVASSQAVYGEGLYRCEEHGTVAPCPRSVEALERADWDARCPLCVGPLTRLDTPESHVSPQNAYGASKLGQEVMALTLGRQYGIPTTALRYSIVQGPRQSFYNAYSGACRIFSLSHFLGRTPTIYEDGLQLRDFVNIQDVVAANLLVHDHREADYEIFNVGGGRAYTIREFEAIVAREFGHVPSTMVSRKFRFGDTRHIISDISKLRALGWSPSRTADDSVAAYVAWLRTERIEDALAVADAHMRQLRVVRSTADA